MKRDLIEKFTSKALGVGAQVHGFASLAQAAHHVAGEAGGELYLPDFSSARRVSLDETLVASSCRLSDNAATAAAGLTGANFALADTGTVVLDSTAEAVRLATTLPARHFVLLDPRKIFADGMAAVPLLREFHRRRNHNFLAYITGPSRTADIERVLTIGVHGPRELHILLVEGLSDDWMEM